MITRGPELNGWWNSTKKIPCIFTPLVHSKRGNPGYELVFLPLSTGYETVLRTKGLVYKIKTESEKRSNYCAT